MRPEKLRIINEGHAVKKDRFLDGKSFTYTPCQYCEEWISNCGFASKNHYDMHVRNGDVVKTLKSSCNCKNPKTETCLLSGVKFCMKCISPINQIT